MSSRAIALCLFSFSPTASADLLGDQPTAVAVTFSNGNSASIKCHEGACKVFLSVRGKHYLFTESQLGVPHVWPISVEMVTYSGDHFIFGVRGVCPAASTDDPPAADRMRECRVSGEVRDGRLVHAQAHRLPGG